MGKENFVTSITVYIYFKFKAWEILDMMEDTECELKIILTTVVECVSKWYNYVIIVWQHIHIN